ncbi:hypothetical protein, partial [Enterococcus sp. AZ135]|uniref:hypothetical protein n=1 Tax=Enterococcus sp. AZ135 TaxID=2774631 RepID=UPI003F687B34
VIEVILVFYLIHMISPPIINFSMAVLIINYNNEVKTEQIITKRGKHLLAPAKITVRNHLHGNI